jgi:protein gp37
MAETTGIAWTDSTFNPWIGCTKVSPGCDNCYAAVSTPARSMRVMWGAGQQRHRTRAQNWKAPESWNDQHEAFKAAHGRRRRVFCASLADVFDNEVQSEWRADLFALIDRTPNLDWLLLTKRVGNVMPMLREMGREALPEQVWQGVSVVNQEEARRELPKLTRIEASVRWVSYEPALSELDLFEWVMTEHGKRQLIEGLDWVIAGGESGPKARPIRREWVDLVRKQCEQCGVAFFFKQWGGATAAAGGCELDGAEVKAWPCTASRQTIKLSRREAVG